MVMVKKQFHGFCKDVHCLTPAKFKSVTLNFLCITLFVSLFQRVFGQENSIVGIILIIIMSSSMLRDLTSTPVKQFFIQVFTLESMAIAAFLVTHFAGALGFFVNFIILLVLLYAFTFEYATHLYMPYILSYLFLLFISPATATQLPRRLLAMLLGAVCVMLYQLTFGRNRIKEVPREVLTALVEEAQDCVRCLLSGEGKPDHPELVHRNLCRLSRLIFERRKRTLCISQASFAMLECGRGLEHLILQLYAMEGLITPSREVFLKQAEQVLASCHGFVTTQPDSTALVNPADFTWQGDAAEEISGCLMHIYNRLLQMIDPDERTVYHKTALSLWVRVKAALNVSSVRVVYALRIALLLAVGTLFVQYFRLPHGKWLLFTLASVSMPCADDVLGKAGKRLFATLLGGSAFILAFCLVPGITGRTIFMMLGGYLTAYFLDYKFTFACSTIGALGGAALTTAFGLTAIGSVFLVRLGYICLGIAVAYLCNCVLFPYKRRMATQSLWDKHLATAETLIEVCHGEKPDLQLYFSLLIQAYLQEEKLCTMINFQKEQEGEQLFQQCQEKIRSAHLCHG